MQRWWFSVIWFAVAVYGQDGPDRFLNVPGWQGSFSSGSNASGQITSNGMTYSWQVNQTATGTVTLDHWDSAIQGWTGTVSGSIRVQNTYTTSIGKCASTYTATASAGLGIDSQGKPRKAFLVPDVHGSRYALYFSDGSVQTHQVITNCDGTVTMTADLPYPWYPAGRFQVPFPSTGLQLSASPSIAGVFLAGNLIYPAPQADFDVSWSLSPMGSAKPEVVVDPAGFETWRPQGANDELTPGNALNITATLRNSDGTPLLHKAVSFKFELTDCSAEPGVAMNYPLVPISPAPFDLQFETARNPSLLITDPKRQKAETMPGTYDTASAVLTAYDWGAYALLRVTATLQDGQQIVGYLKGDPAETDIRIPKRAQGSRIADAWKALYPGDLGDDASDNENDPVGNGNVGDGLTLYEEYRGFMEGGVHIGGNPLKKDFFVRDLTNRFENGFLLFQAASGLVVHYKLRADEMPDTRVINENHAAAPHEVDQHAVRVRIRNDGLDYAEAVSPSGEMGPPRATDYVQIWAALGNRSTLSLFGNGDVPGAASFDDATIAHELGHSVGIYHHGDRDVSPHWFATTDANGQIQWTEDGTPIRVLNEDGTPATIATKVQGQEVSLGVIGGQHSGVQDCLMRYDIAQAYRDRGDPTVRYWIGADQQVSQTIFCSRKTGTGENDPAHDPRPRFGDADTNRGDCIHQIVVNDAQPSPIR